MIKFNLFFIISIFIIILIFIIISINILIHPVFIICIIIIYGILICLNISIWRTNFIYSIIIFLIIIRGLLIIFLYFSRLISNEQITLQRNKLLISIIILNLFYIFYKIITNSNRLVYLNKEKNSINSINEKIFNNILNIYNYPFNNISILSIIYLLITLFIIIKITSLNSKPIRKIY